MKNFSKIFLFSFLFILSFLTFASVTSAAINTPLGQACSPDDINQDRTCPYCPNTNGSRQFVVDWNLGTINPVNGQEPFCTVSCSIPGSSSVSCDGAIAKDNNDYAGITNLLKPKDFVIFRDPKVGSVYQASCCVMKNLQCITTPVKSKKMTVADCISNACLENRFQDIMNSLNSYQETFITEKNLNDWEWGDPKDNTTSSAQMGSGDEADIKYQLEVLQACMAVDPPLSSQFIGMVNVIEGLKKYDSARDARPLSFIYLTGAEENGEIKFTYLGLHATVFLGFDYHNSDYSQIRIKILDSNSPGGARVINCAKKKISVGLTNPFAPTTVYSISDPDRYSRGYLCEDGIPISPFWGELDIMAPLKKNAVRENTMDWLSKGENQMYIKNFGAPSSPLGVCSGWTEFVLKVAYLGNFAGFDCHPDGTQSAIPKDNFLASILTSITKLWPIFPSIDK